VKLKLTPVALALLLLAGCAGTPAAAPTETPAPTPSTTRTPTPTPEPVGLAAIRMDAAGLTLLDGSGDQVDFIGFLDDPDQAIARLTEALQAEPVIEATYKQSSSGTPTTVYRWGGFLLQVARVPALPDERRMGANFVEPTLGTIRLVGPGDVSVGDPISTLPEPVVVGSYEGSPNGPRHLFGDPLPVTRYSEPYDEYVQGFDTASTPWDAPAEDHLVELLAPVTYYGGPGFRRLGQWEGWGA